MPAFASPLDEQVPELEGRSGTRIWTDPAVPAARAEPAVPPGVRWDARTVRLRRAVLRQASTGSTRFSAWCCRAFPQFVARFKNTNLLTAGLRMLSTMPAQLGDVRGHTTNSSRRPTRKDAQAALARLGTALSSLRQSTMAAFQKEATP